MAPNLPATDSLADYYWVEGQLDDLTCTITDGPVKMTKEARTEALVYACDTAKFSTCDVLGNSTVGESILWNVVA